MGTAPLRRRLLFALATSERFERVARATRAGERAAFRRASPYVSGVSLDDAMAVAERLRRDGVRASIDFFGEGVSDPREVARVIARYVELAHAVTARGDGAWISLDLSHVGLDRQPIASLVDALERVCACLPDGSRIQVGAEEARRTDKIVGVLLAAGARDLPVGATVQANLRRSGRDAERLAAAGIHIRLVKGAYLERLEVATPYGAQTDAAYGELARRLSELAAEYSLGTHDAPLRDSLLSSMPRPAVEMLLGVRSEDAASLARAGVDVRLYVPYGPDWFRYGMRRWAEAQGGGSTSIRCSRLMTAIVPRVSPSRFANP